MGGGDDRSHGRNEEMARRRLHGRDEEMARLDGLLGGAVAGAGGVLVVRGDAGIGKSALLDHAAERARDTYGMRVVRATGFETEAEIPFASLHLLLHPVLDRLDGLPERQADALRAALGMGAGATDDLLLTGLATLSLLVELGSDGPVLCVVDDAHWLDHASARVLLFAARRLTAEGIVLLFGARLGHGFNPPGLPSLRLTGLDEASAGRLLDEHAPDLPRAARSRAVAECAGNPLALLGLPAYGDGPGGVAGVAGVAGVTYVAGVSGAGDVLPLPRRLEDAYAFRVAGLSEPARRALLVAAAGDGDLAVIERVTGPAPLQEAERARLVWLRGGTGRLEFGHPLLRSAILNAAEHGELGAVHAELADVLADDPGRQVWHRAHAATGPDDEIADALARAAVRADALGGHAGAGAALARAAALTTDPALKARRLVDAARAAADAGLSERARALLREARPAADDPHTLARLHALRARAAFEEGAPEQAHDLLVRGAAALGRGAEAGALLVDAARNAWQLGDPERLRSCADRLTALTPGPGPGDGLGPAIDAVCGAAIFLEQGPARAVPVMRPLVAYGRTGATAPRALRINAAFVAGLIGDFDAGRQIAAEVAEECRNRGDVGWLPLAHLPLAASELYLGRFREAAATATEGLRLAADTGQPHRGGHLHGMLAWLAAVRGDLDEARGHAARCHDHYDTTGIVNSLAWAEWALALADLGRGDGAGTVRRLAAAQEGPGRHQIQGVYAAPDWVEAASRVGDPAHEPLARYTSWAEASGQAWADAVLHRCRALTQDDWERAYALFTTAVRLHADSGRPWEAARTRLLFGERLRRERHKTEARAHLRSAAETFERLGATPWAERARAELRATGDPGTPSGTSVALDALSPQELQIVRLAATGMTNKEIGARLFLSPKTVGYHLYRAFPKLGVASRAQLAGLDLTEA
ncbi:AAA family ATPase [Streptomyces sp. NPDC016845]|uniref:helix-turn-helix transcriptional regulator n=1 Tax=Streptomyces sp. NPDC016845 TaxID=3364972 RepID=UPI003796E741